MQKSWQRIYQCVHSIKTALKIGKPCFAECGGFMYLLERFQAASGEIYEWTGAISGETFMTAKLNRFGYITLTAESDNVFCKIGEKINGMSFIIPTVIIMGMIF